MPACRSVVFPRILIPLTELDMKFSICTLLGITTLPKITYAAPQSVNPLQSTPGAPTMKSLVPSPFTSPAEETDAPNLSPVAAPYILTALPVDTAVLRSSVVMVPAFPYTRYAAPALAAADGDPIRMSA
jgi:hypothetical protein